MVTGLVFRRVTMCCGRVRQIVAAAVAVRIVRVNSGPALILWQQFFDFPVVHACSDRKFQVLLGDGIPIL